MNIEQNTALQPPYKLLNIGGRSLLFYTCNRTGAYHLEKGLPSQDACYIDVMGSTAVFCAIADGHGDERHDLSEFGAAFAVKAGVAVMKSIYQAYEHSQTLLHRGFRDDLPRLVLRKWKSLVKEDAMQRAVSIEHDLFVRYGTTLLLVMVTEKGIWTGQLGDGETLYMLGDQVQPVYAQQNQQLIGNVTHSLSSPHSLHQWRMNYLQLPSQKGFLFVTTDGLSNCFIDDEQFYLFVQECSQFIKENNEKEVAQRVPQILDVCSTHGSRDDIAILFIGFNF